LAEKDNNIFTDEFPENKGEPPKKPKDDELDDSNNNSNLKETPTTKKARKKYAVVGVIIVGVIITLSYFVVAGIEFPEEIIQNVNPIELGKSIDNPQEDKTQEDKTPFKDVSSTSDKVEVEKTKEPIGYFMVTTDDDWYGDFVDIRKIPSKIEKSGSMKVNFRCFTDEFQGTSTYFGTFRNQVKPNLTVEVYINGLEVESQTTTTNKALILEGSCYGHES